MAKTTKPPAPDAETAGAVPASNPRLRKNRIHVLASEDVEAELVPTSKPHKYRDGTQTAFGGVDAYRSVEDVWESTLPFLDAFCHHVGGFNRVALIEPTQTETQATLNGETWIDPDAIDAVREALIPICRYVLLLSDNLIHHLLFFPNRDTKKADLKRIRNASHVSSRAGIFDDFLLKIGGAGNVIIYKNQTIKERLSIYVSVCEDQGTRSGDDIETALEEYLLEKDKLNQKFESVAEAKAVGETYERLRESMGVSKKAMMRDTGIATSNIRKFELGAASPTLESVQKYAEALGYEARIEFVPKDRS